MQSKYGCLLIMDIFYIILFTAISRNYGCDIRSLQKKIISKVLSTSYDKTEAPTAPLVINMTYVLLEVAEIDELNRQITLVFSFVQYCARTPSSPKFIGSLGIYSNGMIKTQNTIIAGVSCELAYSTFPFDDLYCTLVSGTWISKDYVTLNWLDGKAMLIDRNHIKLDSFMVGEYFYEDASNDIVGDRHIIILQLLRYPVYYYLSVFIPSAFFVLIAWSTFLFPPEGIRISLCLTSLVCTNILFTSVSSSFPKVGYMKGIDFWMLGCILFIVFPILVYIGVSHVSYWAKLKNECKDDGLDEKIPFIQGTKYSVRQMAWWIDRICAPLVFLIMATGAIAFFATYYRATPNKEYENIPSWASLHS